MRLESHTAFRLLAALAVAASLTACGGPKTLTIPPPAPYDRHDVPQPESREINYVADGFDKQVIDKVKTLLDLSHHYRKLTNNPKQAANVNAFDEVENSAWFTNRNAIFSMSPGAIARGADQGTGPDTSSPWRIVSAKTQGVTPGFQIIDGRGDRYVVKFDPIGYAEMMSAAEVISTKLFYAAGYFTPENYITVFDPDMLELGEDVKFTDYRGRKRAMTQADLEEILSLIEIRPDGKIRALASKFIEGVPLGPFRYEKIRKDDLNDVIPHHHRRELRGMRVMAAWLNHFDTKSGNTHDSYITENGKRYVRHYLIDFGSTLGSGSNEPTRQYHGYENFIEPEKIFLYTTSLGLYVRPYELQHGIPYTSIGRYYSKYFEPHKYKFGYPNPAFRRMTNRDGYWGAKLVMSFSDEQLRAVVAEGQYSNPEAAEYLINVLIERRDVVGRFYFSRVNPLDRFRIDTGGDGSRTLGFTDMMVETGLEPATAQYRYEIRRKGAPEVIGSGTVAYGSGVPLPGPGGFDSGDVIEITLHTKRDGGDWGKWVKVYLKKDEAGGIFNIIGLLRQD